MQKFELSASQIQSNIDGLLNWMKQEFQKSGLDAFYISSSDMHLSEYSARQECHRYYVTGFTGSTAEVLCLKDGPIFLFVDGRYYEQADLEAKFRGVEVVKVPFAGFTAAFWKKCKNIRLRNWS